MVFFTSLYDDMTLSMASARLRSKLLAVMKFWVRKLTDWLSVIGSPSVQTITTNFGDVLELKTVIFWKNLLSIRTHFVFNKKPLWDFRTNLPLF